jgi:hypothetical protein
VIPEELQTEDSTRAQRKDERGLLMELGALADAAQSRPDNNSIADVDEVGYGFVGDGVPCFPKLLEAAHDRFQADERAGLWPSLGRTQNHVRVKEVAQGIKVPGVPRLETSSHDLHVLLRNTRSPARKLRVFIRRG